jgi:hypothetical protein
MPQRAELDVRQDPSAVAPGLQVLLAGTVDYAGIFPPASLHLEEAARRYVDYRSSENSWMLGAFVCPALRLRELLPLPMLFEGDSFPEISVLLSGGASSHEFLERLADDLGAVIRFREEIDFRVSIRQLEGKIPDELLETDVVTVRKFVDCLASVRESTEVQDAAVFLEVPLDERRHQLLPVVNGALGAFNRQRLDSLEGPMGSKFRMGGPGVPSADAVAYGIAASRDAGVRFKATAGLHHPFYSHDLLTDSVEHGFINVHAAAVLAAVHHFEVDALVPILTDPEPGHFKFSSDGLEWMTHKASISQIERGRREGIVSFGSCSFEEPIEDLKRLALL